MAFYHPLPHLHASLLLSWLTASLCRILSRLTFSNIAMAYSYLLFSFSNNTSLSSGMSTASGGGNVRQSRFNQRCGSTVSSGMRIWDSTLHSDGESWDMTVGKVAGDQRVTNLSICTSTVEVGTNGKQVAESIRSCGLWINSQASRDRPGAAIGHQGQHLDGRADLRVQGTRLEPAGMSLWVAVCNCDNILKVMAAASLPSRKFCTSSSFG